MINHTNTLTKAIGLALIISGAGLVYWGFQMSDSIAAQITKNFTGALPDAVMYRYLGGAASCVVGLFLVAKK